MPFISKSDHHTIFNKPYAHMHLGNSTSGLSIAVAQTWQKLDLTSGNPVIEANGGFTWDAINKWFIWDSGSILNFPITADFIGDAQLQVTSSISGTITIELGLVLNSDVNNPNSVPPILITPISFTNQAKISGYGANDSFGQFNNPNTGDKRVVPNDKFDIWIRCTDATATPNFQVDGFNSKITPR